MIEGQEWEPSTLDNYDTLYIIADAVEDGHTDLKVWFQHFRSVIASVIQKCEQLQDQLDRLEIEEPEEDVLDSMNDWLYKHMLSAVDRVLNDSIVHNGPLFSVAQAIKNTYEHLTPELQYRVYYHLAVEEPADGIGERVVQYLATINSKIKKLIIDYLKFLQVTYPFFLRMAQMRWKPPTTKKNSFERLASTPQFPES